VLPSAYRFKDPVAGACASQATAEERALWGRRFWPDVADAAEPVAEGGPEGSFASLGARG